MRTINCKRGDVGSLFEGTKVVCGGLAAFGNLRHPFNCQPASLPPIPLPHSCLPRQR
jgi:hypothetical protein